MEVELVDTNLKAATISKRLSRCVVLVTLSTFCRKKVYPFLRKRGTRSVMLFSIIPSAPGFYFSPVYRLYQMSPGK